MRVTAQQTARTGMLVVILLCSCSEVWAGHTLTIEQGRVLAGWLSENTGHRRATDEDCKCSANIEDMREGYGGPWKGVPDYHPYVATGDFDTDGDNDFAVVVVNDSGSWTLLIFNAPFQDDFLPAFVDNSINFQGGGGGLSFGPPRSQPYRLIIGPFESHGVAVVPKNGTYEIEYGGL